MGRAAGGFQCSLKLRPWWRLFTSLALAMLVIVSGRLVHSMPADNKRELSRVVVKRRLFNIVTVDYDDPSANPRHNPPTKPTKKG